MEELACVAQKVNLPHVMPASHVSANSNPGCSTLNPGCVLFSKTCSANISFAKNQKSLSDEYHEWALTAALGLFLAPVDHRQ